MNIVSCGENCRYQNDGRCTRSDLAVNSAAGLAASAPTDSKCCYFEQR